MLNLTKAEAVPYDGYIYLAIKPVFNHEGCKQIDWSLGTESLFYSAQDILSSMLEDLLNETSDVDFELPT